MGKVTYITEEGLRKMKEEYDRMTKIERPAISKTIGEAIEKGRYLRECRIRRSQRCTRHVGSQDCPFGRKNCFGPNH